MDKVNEYRMRTVDTVSNVARKSGERHKLTWGSPVQKGTVSAFTL